MTSSTRLRIDVPLLFPSLHLILELCKSLVADVYQEERHAECEQNIRDEKENDLFEWQNSKEQDSCGLTRGDGPGCLRERDGIHEGKICSRSNNSPEYQSAIMPENICTEQGLNNDRGQRPEENDG